MSSTTHLLGDSGLRVIDDLLLIIEGCKHMLDISMAAPLTSATRIGRFRLAAGLMMLVSIVAASSPATAGSGDSRDPHWHDAAPRISSRVWSELETVERSVRRSKQRVKLKCDGPAWNPC